MKTTLGLPAAAAPSAQFRRIWTRDTGRRLALVAPGRSAALILALCGAALASEARGQAVTEFPIPTPASFPHTIAAGPDGNLWFAEGDANKIGRTTTAGLMSEFPVPTSGSDPTGIAAGPDGSLWFTEGGATNIGRITTAGVITEFTFPAANGGAGSIAAGPDGNLWFTENVSKIGRITTAGVVTEFTIPTPDSTPFSIAAGADGNLWFTEATGNRIGRITTAGVITEFVIPTAGSTPVGIAAGPDGNLWFAEFHANQIGRITAAGVMTEFTIPTANSGPRGIGAGPDGNLWFTEVAGNKIGRITTAGAITEITIPTAKSNPRSITAGPDGNLWFTEAGGNKIGRITSGAAGNCVTGPSALCMQNGRFKVQLSWSVPSQGRGGVGTAFPLTSDTGYFWFFDNANVEVVIKVLDARGVNQHFWVFYGALSNVKYTITVTDTKTGLVKTYDNPDGNVASVGDTMAFAADSTSAAGTEFAPEAASAYEIGTRSDAELYAMYGALTQEVPALMAETASCAAGGATLCLNQSRFQVKVDWSVPSQGRAGHGTAVPVTGDTGYFWFFDSTNVELMVKVLDGRPVNGHFWVFYGALSNVKYTITVTDTQTGAVKIYDNPDGNLASVADTASF